MSLLLDMGPVVASEYTGQYTVRRRPNRGYTGGVLDAPSDTTETLGAQVTPAEGSAQVLDPAGNYQRSSWLVITEGDLQPQGDTREADVILLNGATGLPGSTPYRVADSQDFEASGGFCAAVVELVKP